MIQAGRSRVRDSMKPTITGINYLDMLQLWLIPQLQEDSEDFIFQQDGDSLYFHLDVRARSLDWAHFWQWRSSSSVASIIILPNPLWFFVWGYIKDRVYVPPMSSDLPQLRQRIVEAEAAVDRDMLKHMWHELRRASATSVTIRNTAPQTVNISSIWKVSVGEKLGVYLLLLTCSPIRGHTRYCTAQSGNSGGTYVLPHCWQLTRRAGSWTVNRFTLLFHSLTFITYITTCEFGLIKLTSRPSSSCFFLAKTDMPLVVMHSHQPTFQKILPIIVVRECLFRRRKMWTSSLK